MGPISRKKIRSSLLKKGFKEEMGPHVFYFLYVKGKKSSVRTMLSHGSGYKDYSADLLRKMKAQLCLDTNRQLTDFIKCPMTEDEYLEILRVKGRIR